MKRIWFRKAPVVILIASGALFVFGGATMFLWNGILPSVLHVGAITYWQAIGILLLSKILFGGMRGRRSFGGHWKSRMAVKWNNMTDEEKEKLQGQMHCGHWQPTA